MRAEATVTIPVAMARIDRSVRMSQRVSNQSPKVPAFDDPGREVFADPESAVLSHDGSDTVVVYFSDRRTETGELRGLDDERPYRAEWFDPRTGASLLIDPRATADHGVWVVPARPSAQDWVLRVW
jgi:hypothetical protein